jgi:hypothetical protein
MDEVGSMSAFVGVAGVSSWGITANKSEAGNGLR